MSCDGYIRHLSKLRGVRGKRNMMTKGQLEAVRKTLPSEWFWMVELSHTLLYTGIGNKLGELLIGDWDGKKATQSAQLWCRVRLPGHFLADVKGTMPVITVSLREHAEVYRFDRR